MRLTILAAAAFCSAMAIAQQQKPATTGMPPLVDRELFFGDPEYAGAQISPDGKYIAFIRPYQGTRNVWVKKADEPFEAAHAITAETKRPIAAYFWTRDSKFILYVKDNAGDENYNVYAVDPTATPEPGAGVPVARDLTGTKGARIVPYELPKTDPDTIYIGINDRDKAWHDLYKLKVSTGEKTLLRKNTERITGWVFDRQGNLRVATRSAENGDTEFLRVDPDKFTKIYSCGVLETCAPNRFHKNGKQLYIITNHEPGLDKVEFALLDVQTGAVQKVESDPLNRVDFGGAAFSDKTDDLVMTIYVDERVRRYFKDKELEADYNTVKKQVGDVEVGFGSRTNDERLWIVSTGSDVEPGAAYLYDRPNKKLTLQYRVREKLPREALSPMKAVTYKSSDGLEIPAYLTLPKGIAPKGIPVLIVPHGGPWARDGWGYDPIAQFLANRGYGVLQPNFRGSTGYGKKFLDAGNLEWGRKMQDDITWGVKYLVAEGIADPKRVGIMGGSYGGYATLAGVTFTPDLYAAAVDIVGPSNLKTLLESIPPYWEPIRKMFAVRMGDVSTPEGQALIKERSPLTLAAKIKTPLMVVQGANDPRVNIGEANQIVVALRDRSFPVEYIVAPDEGHGFARPINNLAMFMAVEKFLAKHLDGRYQEGGTPETIARLKEITVDPKTVTLAKKIDPASVSAPKPAASLTPGVAKYKASIAAGGQNINLDLTNEVKDDPQGWVVTETMQSPMGPVTDKATLDKQTLQLRHRAVKQGPVSIDLDIADNKATGKMNINGQERPISADLGGPLYADAAGAMQAIAALPLADGYEALFRNFDLQKQKPSLKRAKVAGSEKVTVPAGEFDAWKVEIVGAEGGPDQTTIWVDKSTRKVVKISSKMAQMGGATLTAELQ